MAEIEEDVMTTAAAVAMNPSITEEDRAWLERKRAEFSAAGRLIDEHRCTDALNGDAAELAALRAGQPSPHPEGAGRSL